MQDDNNVSVVPQKKSIYNKMKIEFVFLLVLPLIYVFIVNHYELDYTYTTIGFVFVIILLINKFLSNGIKLTDYLDEAGANDIILIKKCIYMQIVIDLVYLIICIYRFIHNSLTIIGAYGTDSGINTLISVIALPYFIIALGVYAYFIFTFSRNLRSNIKKLELIKN